MKGARRAPRSRAPAADASPFVPDSRDLSRLARASRDCRGCPLYRDATQTVFGEGPAGAGILFVGEQPGDREDLQGRPFVGPAGAELQTALDAAGISRDDVYVTNAVKHFKFEERGKRRIHKKPRVSEVVACHPWLEAEIRAVGPSVIVALGVTAAESLARMPPAGGVPVVRALHPAAVLRAPDPEGRRQLHDRLIRELRKAKRLETA
jgi:DNA polymerase